MKGTAQILFRQHRQLRHSRCDNTGRHCARACLTLVGQVTDHSIVSSTSTYVLDRYRRLRHQTSRVAKVPTFGPSLSGSRRSRQKQPDEYHREREIYASPTLVPMLAETTLVLSRSGPPCRDQGQACSLCLGTYWQAKAVQERSRSTMMEQL